MAPEPDLVFPPFRLDLEQHYLWRGTDRVPLRPKAFAVLHYLAAHAPHLVTPADVLLAVWTETYVSEGLLRSYMRELRAVLGDTAKSPRFIETVLRRGWRFLAPVTILPPSPIPHTVDAVQTRDLATALELASSPAPLLTAATSTPVAPIMSRIRRMVPGEPKQVTVLVAGLHGVPALAQAVETEGLYELLSRAATLMREAVERFDGAVTQCSGDRLLALFGAPIAQEDHVVRALQAALEVQRAFMAYADELRCTQALTLALAVGVHTGPVVLGPRRPAAPPDTTVYGVTVSLAERVQGLATGGTIAVSAAVRQQAMDFFHFEVLGEWTLPEIVPPVRVYACTGVAQGASRLEAFLHRHRSPFVGRAPDLELLGTIWARVRQGQGQVVVLFGEAGIGKSRLAHEFQCTLPTGRALYAHTLSYGQAMPYHALIPLLRTVVGLTDHDTPQHQRQAIRACLAAAQPPLTADEPLLAHLLGVPLEPAHLPQLPPDEQKQRLQHACLQVVLQHAAGQPLCLLIEDLHWLDPSSQALLDLVVTALAGQPVLVLGTARPGFRDPWTAHTYYHRLTLAPLSDALTETFVRHYLQPYEAATALTALLQARTAGNPFFLEETLRTMQEQTLMVVQDGVYVLQQTAHLAMPASIQGILAARIDQLTAEAKHLLQTAAVIGREVPWSLLTMLADLPDEALHWGLAHLQSAELLYETRVVPVRTYTFKHALTQEAGYQSLLQSTRQQVHQRLARVLAAQCPETTATQPALLAHHYTEGGLQVEALPYWHQAGRRAIAHSAYAEARQHLTTGLAVLATVPETPARHQYELDFLTALTVVLGVTRGQSAPELEPVLTRATALTQQVGELSQHGAVLYALWSFHNVRAEHQAAQTVAEQHLALAQRQHDSAQLLGAYYALGTTFANVGSFVPARTHLEHGIALYDAQPQATPPTLSGAVQNYGVSCRALLAWVLWELGYPDQAVQRSQEALTMAHTLARPFDLVGALRQSAQLHASRREWQTVQTYAETVLALATAHGFARYGALGVRLRGWALAAQGEGAAGLAQMRQGLAAVWATGAAVSRPGHLAQLAEAYGQGGQVEEAGHLVREALAVVATTGERFYEAELHRLHGELLWQAIPDASRAEACFQQALAVARRQQARSWELRAAMSLGRLWQRQGKRAAARELLAPVYGWFTEGFDTADLQEARALLEDLGT